MVQCINEEEKVVAFRIVRASVGSDGTWFFDITNRPESVSYSLTSRRLYFYTNTYWCQDVSSSVEGYCVSVLQR